MKRVDKFILAAVLAATPGAGALGASYRLGHDSLSLTLAPVDPLWKENRANPFANNVSFRYLMAPKDTNYLPSDILVSVADLNGGEPGYKRLSFKDPDPGNNTYWQMKAAVNMGLFRISWEGWAEAELYIHGGLTRSSAPTGESTPWASCGSDGLSGSPSTLFSEEASTASSPSGAAPTT